MTTVTMGGRGPPSSLSSDSLLDKSGYNVNSSSEVGYLSDGGNSNSSGSSHSSRCRNKTSDRKKQKKALSGVKIKPPFVWNGTPNLDVFDQWTYEVDTWGKLNGLNDWLILKLIVQFLSDKPSQCFMRHVATRQKDWTVRQLYAVLFDYCFPTNYKARSWCHLESTTQGKTRVHDFVHEVQQ